LVAVFVSNSLIIENGGGELNKGGNTRGSVAELVVTDARRGRATVKKFCIKVNRTLHPYRESALPPSQEANPTALISHQNLIMKKPTFCVGLKTL